MLLVSRPLLEWYVRLGSSRTRRVEIRREQLGPRPGLLAGRGPGRRRHRGRPRRRRSRPSSRPSSSSTRPAATRARSSGSSGAATSLRRRTYAGSTSGTPPIGSGPPPRRSRPWRSRSRHAPACRGAGSCSRRRTAGTSSRSSVGRGTAAGGLARVRRVRPHVGQPRAGRRAVRDATAGCGRDVPLPRQPATALGASGPVPRRTRGHRRRVLRLRPGLRAGDDRGLDRGRGARPLPVPRAATGWPSGSTGPRRPPSTPRGRSRSAAPPTSAAGVPVAERASAPTSTATCRRPPPTADSRRRSSGSVTCTAVPASCSHRVGRCASLLSSPARPCDSAAHAAAQLRRSSRAARRHRPDRRNSMRTFYCECGQPLTMVAAGFPAPRSTSATTRSPGWSTRPWTATYRTVRSSWTGRGLLTRPGRSAPPAPDRP